jgi:mercuric ion binding protein
MKKLLPTLLVLLLAPTIMFAADQSLTLKVAGNCGSCKKRIVKAATSVEGVSDASWDKNTKEFKATYDDAKAKPEDIKKAILKAGYDVEGATADQTAYDKLPSCCKYRDVTHD